MKRFFCAAVLLSLLFSTVVCMQQPPVPMSLPIKTVAAVESVAPVPVEGADRFMRCFRCVACPPRIFCCGQDDGKKIESGTTVVQCRPGEFTCCQKPGSQMPTCRVGVYRDPARLGCRSGNMWCLCLTCPCLCPLQPCLVGDRPENCFCTCKDCGRTFAFLTFPAWFPVYSIVTMLYSEARMCCCPRNLPACLHGHEEACDRVCGVCTEGVRDHGCWDCAWLFADDQIELYGEPYVFVFCCCAHHKPLPEDLDD